MLFLQYISVKPAVSHQIFLQCTFFKLYFHHLFTHQLFFDHLTRKTFMLKTSHNKPVYSPTKHRTRKVESKKQFRSLDGSWFNMWESACETSVGAGQTIWSGAAIPLPGRPMRFQRNWPMAEQCNCSGTGVTWPVFEQYKKWWVGLGWVRVAGRLGVEWGLFRLSQKNQAVNCPTVVRHQLFLETKSNAL